MNTRQADFGMPPLKGSCHCGRVTFDNPLTVVNIRCLDGFDPDGLPVQHFDGRAV